MAKRTVHIVDDEAPVRRSLALMLKVSGYAVSTFESGLALLDAAEALVPGALLLDVRMPDMDGIQVQKQLASRGVALPVVIMTGHGDLSVAASALKAGAVACLEKPFGKAVLIGALDTVFLKIENPEAYERRQFAAAARVHALDDEERALLVRLARGRSNEEIAAELAMSGAACEVRRVRLFAKLGVENTSGALSMASAAGLQPSD